METDLEFPPRFSSLPQALHCDPLHVAPSYLGQALSFAKQWCLFLPDFPFRGLSLAGDLVFMHHDCGELGMLIRL